MSEVTYFGFTTYRGQGRKFGIKSDDRRRHFYVIGKTGVGKTSLLENMAIQDIQQDRGVAFIDPHGETAERLLHFVPGERVNDVIYFNPADIDYPLPFNVMERVDISNRHLVASGLLGAFKKIWPDVWSARMEYLLHNAILALLEVPNSTLLGVNRILSDPAYRKKVVAKLHDPIVKSFWTQEFARYPQRYEAEATAAVQNKIGQFISNPLIRNIIGQTSSAFDLRKVMDEGKILIVNLSKGKVGEENSLLLGALLVTKLQLAAMSRVDIPEQERLDFYLYVDEFQNFATEAFATILSEARKYRLNLTIAHQYISQLILGKTESSKDQLRDAVFGNVGTIVAFRVGPQDAEFLEREFLPEFTQQDLVNLPKYHIYVRLLIDGLATRPFSAVTLSPPPFPASSFKDSIIKASRDRYGVPALKVTEKISKWTEFLGKLSQQSRTAQLPPSRPTTLWDALCSNCGKWTRVVFKPDDTRPVYCKECRQKLQSASQLSSVRTAAPRSVKIASAQPAELDQSISLKSLPARREQPRPKPKRGVELEKLKQAIQAALRRR